MNESIENFLRVCNFLNMKIDVVNGFVSGKYEVNRISNIVFLGVLIIPTVLLNAVPVITIWKTAQLRKKPCYFVILLQSSVDLSVGCVSLPILIVALLAPFTTNIDICTVTVAVKSISMLPIGLSITTLSALTVERYIGVVHPYSYKILVTRRRIVVFVLGMGLILLLLIFTSYVSQYFIMKYAARAFLAVFFIFSSFAYIQIYLVMRRLSRSEIRPQEYEGKDTKTRRLRELKHAMSCFIVVISFVTLLVPYTLSPFFSRFEKMNLNVYVWWCVALVNLHPTVNSMIFFWRSTVLRKQAIKILKNPGGRSLVCRS